MQLRFICPHCGRVEQVTKDWEGQVVIGWPCIFTYCSCGMRNKGIRVVVDVIRCLSCKESLTCVVEKTFPFKGTLKQIKKKRARNSAGRVRDF
jgi:hypothetical protein